VEARRAVSGIRKLDPRRPWKEVEQSWLEVLRSANNDGILGAEGGQIGGGGASSAGAPTSLDFVLPFALLLAASAPSLQSFFESASLNAFVSVRSWGSPRKRYSNPSSAVSSLACFSFGIRGVGYDKSASLSVAKACCQTMLP